MFKGILMSIRICPICKAKATSPHHIIPKSEGGTNDKRNIVWLSERCHDIVEEIYETTGVAYCQGVIQLVREMLGICESDPRDAYDTTRWRTGRHVIKPSVMGRAITRQADVLLVLLNSEGGRRISCGRCGCMFFCHDGRFSMCAQCRKQFATRLNFPVNTTFKKILGSINDKALATGNYCVRECYRLGNAFYSTKAISPAEALESLTYGCYLAVGEK